MQTVLTPPAFREVRSARRLTPNPSSAARCTASEDAIAASPTSGGFTALLAAYRASGGTVRGDDLAHLRNGHGLGDFIGLARLIASGEVFGFEWRGTLWIPMFQFNPSDLSVCSGSERVLSELGPGFDGWSRAAWFARPNNWLQRRKPVDLMQSDLPAVLSAARADRFLVMA